MITPGEPGDGFATQTIAGAETIVQKRGDTVIFMRPDKRVAVKITDERLLARGALVGLETALTVGFGYEGIRNSLEDALSDGNQEIQSANPGVQLVDRRTVSAYINLLLAADGSSGDFILTADDQTYDCYKLDTDEIKCCKIELPNGYGVRVDLKQLEGVDSDLLIEIVQTAIKAYPKKNRVLNVEKCNKLLSKLGDGIRAFNSERL